ncbi:YciI family protein [Rubrivivax sp. RP6-9]|uniref:YciI family protein n=1 Tax=Rubrivivax sp. RP6-9 TaxID=3415750 RepID=UPI003CC6C9D0
MTRYMIQVRATAMSEAGEFPDDPTLVARMMAFHDEMAKAGVLLDGAGLQPSSQGFRVHYDAGGQARVLDGPFAETKELIAGYTLIDVPSRDDALAWARRFPAPFPGQPCCIEVRPLMGGVDLPPEDAERLIREELAAIKRRG